MNLETRNRASFAAAWTATLLLAACSAETEAADDPLPDAEPVEAYDEPAEDELGVPSQDELDAAAAETIDASNFDDELQKLRDELDSDG